MGWFMVDGTMRWSPTSIHPFFQGGKQKFGICKFLKPHPEGRPNLNPQQVVGGTFAIGSIVTFGLQGNFSLFCRDSTVNRNYHVLDIHKKTPSKKVT